MKMRDRRAKYRCTLWVCFLPFLTAYLLLAGCGGEAGVPVFPVTGKLTKAGVPLGDVTITFLPVDGTSLGSSGQVGADGTFELLCEDGRKGAIAGKHKVLLMANMSASDYESGSGPPVPPFPAEYGDKEKTPKEVDVIESENNITIDIE